MSSTTDTGRAPAPAKPSARKVGLPRLVAIGVALLLLLTMALTTKWLNPEQAAEVNPAAFDPAAFAAKELPQITETVVERAVDLTEFAPALAADPAAAGAKFGVDSGSGKFTVPVKVTAPVDSVDENWITLLTPDVQGGYTVRVPVSNAINGTTVRDVTGEITFGDFADQTTYQSVANNLKLLVQEKVIGSLDLASLPGKTVTVHGAFVTGGAPNQIIVQPLKVEVQG